MSGDRWNPWAVLKASPWVTLQYGLLQGVEAWVIGTPEGGHVITLDERLGRRARRCALAHELVHIELDMLWEPGTAANIVMSGERMVDRIVAEKLVPPDDLEEFAERYDRLGQMVMARDVSDEFDVTVAVSTRALCSLEQRHYYRRSA